MAITRRSFLFGLATVAAAPAIVRAESLMKIWVPPNQGIIKDIGDREFDSWDPKYPHETYDQFIKSTLRGIAAGFGISYHALSMDLADVNYSSKGSCAIFRFDHNDNLFSQNYYRCSSVATGE